MVCENITLTKSYHRLVPYHFFLDWNISRLRIALAKCIAYYVDIKILVITEARATTLKLHIREVQFLSLRYQMFPGQLGFRHGSCCKLLKKLQRAIFFSVILNKILAIYVKHDLALFTEVRKKCRLLNGFFPSNQYMIDKKKLDQCWKLCRWPIMSDLFKVVKIDGKGFGCVATRDIKR